MESSKLTLTHQEIFNNKKSFSNKIHSRILKIIADISKSIEKFKTEDVEEKKLFFNAINHYYHDLSDVIFHLQQTVIKINTDDQGVYDLQNVITKLNKIILLIQESLNLELENCKIQLKRIIIDTGLQVEKLMTIVEYDNLHEHKQEVLDCQHDLVISAEALKFYAQFCNLSLLEFEELVQEVTDKIKNDLIKIKTSHEIMGEDFAHYTRHCVKHLQKTMSYIKTTYTIENFQHEVGNIFNMIDVLSTQNLTDLVEAVRYGDPMGKMVDIIANFRERTTQGCSKIQELPQAQMIKNIASDERVKQLLTHLYVNAINGMTALHQSIEDAIMKKQD